MIKHYCDWCGEEIGTLSKTGLAEHTMLFPHLMHNEWCGKPIGQAYVYGKRNKYIVCDKCAIQIWGLRHDSTRT